MSDHRLQIHRAHAPTQLSYEIDAGAPSAHTHHEHINRFYSATDLWVVWSKLRIALTFKLLYNITLASI